MTYIVFFEIGGKKMKMEVKADSPEDAKYRVYGKMIFHKVELKEDNSEVDKLLNVFGMK